MRLLGPRAAEICDLGGGRSPPQITVLKLEVGSRLVKSWKLEAEFVKKLEVGSRFWKNLEIGSRFGKTKCNLETDFEKTWKVGNRFRKTWKLALTFKSWKGCTKCEVGVNYGES